ncbi:4855_t:CDS:2, partial [Scutellospora calospora]
KENCQIGMPNMSLDILKVMLGQDCKHEYIFEGCKLGHAFEDNPVNVCSCIKVDLNDSEHIPEDTLSYLTQFASERSHILSKYDLDSSPSTIHKTLCIELITEREFFNTLLKEISQSNYLQKQNKENFLTDLQNFQKSLIQVSSPYKKDIYIWRQIFQIYIKAEIFIGNTELDRKERDWRIAQKQLF